MRYLILFTVIFCNIFAEEAVPKWTSKETLSIKPIGQVLPSPDGKMVAFRMLNFVDAANGAKWEPQIYVKDEQGQLRVFTPRTVKPLLFQWTNDGKAIIFIAEGKENQSLWMQDLSASQPVKLLEMQGEISSFKLSSDDSKIAFIFTPATKFDEPLHLRPMDVEKTVPNSRLYMVAFSRLTQKVSVPEALTSDRFSVRPWGLATLDPGFDWSPDGTSMAFTYQMKSGEDEGQHCKVGLLDIKTKDIRELKSSEFNYGCQPRFSPNGTYLAFAVNVEKQPLYYACRICLVDTNTFDMKFLNDTFNGNPGLVGWKADGTSLYVWDFFKTEGIQIYEMALIPEEPVKLLFRTDGWINPVTLSISATNQALGFSYEKATVPQEAYIYDLSKSELRQATYIQSLPNVPLGMLHRITWESFDKKRIEGILITPPIQPAGKQHPLAVIVHGGPVEAWTKRFVGGGWFYDEHMIPLAWGDLVAEGFIVFMPNFRGSTGYGQEFRLLNQKDLGGGDFKDIMSGVTALTDTGMVDPHKMVIFGWSYGGYLASWATTQTDKFRAAVVGAPFTDMISFAGTTDIPSFLPYYLGGPFWAKNPLYLQRAPIMDVQKVKTPVLLFHGELDLRCPVSQSFEFYQALKNQNKPVRMYNLRTMRHTVTDANLIRDCINEVDLFFQNAINN